MRVEVIDEHNQAGHLLHIGSCIGAFSRGRTQGEALAKVYEEADEVAQNLHDGTDPEMELGDLLFSVVNVCRLSGKNPDIALFSATNKFISRFRAMENAIKKAGKCIEDLTLSEMDVYWNTGKRGGERV